MSSSSFLLCANWKMNKNPQQVQSYIREFIKIISLKKSKKIVFFTPALTLFVLQKECSDFLFWGAQNCHFEDEGAFTGENSPLVLKQMGATYCLVGHSERRQLFLENKMDIQKKIHTLIRHSICPIICVGENLAERRRGESFKVIQNQLLNIIKMVDLDMVTIAYEPIWAIGSAEPASPNQIFEMQKYIQQLCESQYKKLQFLYGGSVNIQNAKTLSQIKGVNGFLVGGASLNAQKFCQLSQEIDDS